MSSTGKTGGHFRACKVGSVEAHNERRPEYRESVRKAGLNLYFFEEFTPNNSSWVSEDEKYKGKTVEEVFDCMKNVYREKIGQAPQLKEREVIDKKTGRPKKIAGWSPIREMCVPIKEDTKIEDFDYLRKWLKKYGIEVFRIDIHKDEGYHDEKTGEYKMNLHAHVIASFLNWETAKTVKEGPDMMSQMQTVLAMSLAMERGELKKDTDKEYLTHQQYRKMQEKLDSMEEQLQEQEKEIRNNASTIASQKQQMYFLNGQIKLAEKKLKSFQTMIKNLETQKQQLEQEISALNEQHKTGKISYDELQRRTIDLNNQINEINSKLIDKKNKYNEAEQQLKQAKEIEDKLTEMKSELQKGSKRLDTLANNYQTFKEGAEQEVDEYEEQREKMKEDLKRRVKQITTIDVKGVIAMTRKHLTKRDNILYRRWPEAKEAVDAIVARTTDVRARQFTPPQAVAVEKAIASSGITRKEAASDLLSLADKDFEEEHVYSGWVNKTAEEVMQIADFTHVLSAFLQQQTVGGGGGGSSNDLPKKKDDDRFTGYQAMVPKRKG